MGQLKKSFHTSDEMEVLNVHEGKSGHYKHWMLTIKLFGQDSKPVTVPVLHEDSERDFMHELKALKKSKNWLGFYTVRGRFADVRYAYAITVHRSQGSTYENCFVDAPNIMTDRTRNMVLFPGVRKSSLFTKKISCFTLGFHALVVVYSSLTNHEIIPHRNRTRCGPL